MASLPAGTPLPEFGNTLGALLLGGLFAMAWVAIVSFLAYHTHLNDGCHLQPLGANVYSDTHVLYTRVERWSHGQSCCTWRVYIWGSGGL